MEIRQNKVFSQRKYFCSNSRREWSQSADQQPAEEVCEALPEGH
jgi:hypothetical protein